jgi:hypothetical protein
MYSPYDPFKPRPELILRELCESLLTFVDNDTLFRAHLPVRTLLDLRLRAAKLGASLSRVERRLPRR